MTTIQMQQITKTYRGGMSALRGVSLEIGPGMFGLLGPNGAGKTTLMRIMAGLLRPSGGTLQILGHDMTDRRARQSVQAALGYLPQDMDLYPNLTAHEFLDYMAILKGITERQARAAQIDALLGRMRLADVGSRPLGAFSGGMKHRVGIAQALLGEPKVVIVDEPTVGLDPEERVRIRNILAEVAQRSTVILSTHVIEDIGHSCNNLAIIEKGQVLFQGAPSTLIEQARGRVWSLQTQDDHVPEGLHVVSTLQLRDSIQYRVLGTPPKTAATLHPLEPSLEDGYMLAMRERP